MWTRALVPRVQGEDGLFLAGDWSRLIGHNDAMQSGVAAGCNVGVSAPPSSVQMPHMGFCAAVTMSDYAKDPLHPGLDGSMWIDGIQGQSPFRPHADVLVNLCSKQQLLAQLMKQGCSAAPGM